MLILTILLTSLMPETNFLAEQKKFERVRTAFSNKDKFIAKVLKDNDIKIEELNILIVSYKAEKELDIYAKKKNETAYKKILSYTICSSSGKLGPKRRQGDNQVPEGFYHIDRFNPVSNFYMSLGLNYPNKADKIKSKASDPGGDIFIHGDCVTIGCMPMTDDKIKEIYLFAIHARNNGQLKIPVYSFPFKMTDQNFEDYKKKYKENTELLSFWKTLKLGYDKFSKDNKELNFSVSESGNYIF